jgi:hypothetical protein
MKPDVLLPERHEPPRFRDWDVRLLLVKVFHSAERTRQEQVESSH